MRKPAAVELVAVHLVVLQVVRLDQAGRLVTARYRRPDGVVGADGRVGRVPEPKRLLRDRDAEAPGEVAHRVAGGG